MKHPLRIVRPASESPRINEVTGSVAHPLDLDPPDHVQLRGNRRVIAEQLEQAVRDRDAGAMQLAASRLSRLGVSHGRIVSMATEAACKRGPQ